MKKINYLLLITLVISNFIGCAHYLYSYGSSDIDIIDNECPIYSNRTVLLPPDEDQIYFGVTDNHSLGKKSEWLNNVFNTILNNSYINFKAISYWHENWEERDELFATLRIDSSTEALNTFCNRVGNIRFISKPLFSEPEVINN